MDFKKNIKINHKELSGSLGDIGIFLPLALSLISFNGLNPFSVFFMAGVLYIVSGYYFGHPMPVQPLKALAVISLAIGASVNVISAASIIMGIFLLSLYFASETIIPFLGKIFTKPMIRGIQLGVGLFLVKKGVDSIKLKEFLLHGKESIISINGYALPLGIIFGTASVLFIIKFSRNSKIPTSLIIIAVGLIFGLVSSEPGFISTGDPVGAPTLFFPTLNDAVSAFFLLVIPQIPLTVGNALFATADTAKSYFGEGAKRTTPKSLSLSLGIANVLIGFVGGMPVCHGSGGLTAHYKFGSRTVGSNFIIGTIFVTVGILSLFFPVSFLYLIPASTLGSLLIFIGIEHAMLIEDIAKDKNALFAALTVASVAAATKNLFLGCIAGFLAERLLKN